MATGRIILPIPGIPSDGSSGNAAPAIVRFQGTEGNPKKHFLAASFDAAADEHMTYAFEMPGDYASGGVVRGLGMTNDTGATEDAIIAARLGAITPADADTPVEHATAAASTATVTANSTEARRLLAFSITLANLDSVAAGDLVILIVHRDADNASDDLTSDFEIIALMLEYTTS